MQTGAEKDAEGAQEGLNEQANGWSSEGRVKPPGTVFSGFKGEKGQGLQEGKSSHPANAPFPPEQYWGCRFASRLLSVLSQCLSILTQGRQALRQASPVGLPWCWSREQGELSEWAM